MLYSLCIPFHGYKTLCCLPMQTHTLLWLPLKLCCGFPLLVRQPHCSRRSTEQQNALSFIILISTSSSFFSSAAQENIQSRSELSSLHVSESLKLTVHLTFFFFFFTSPFCSFISWLYAVYTVAASRWQICSGLCGDPYAQHALQHRAVGRGSVSECDLPSGVEWRTGADTVSLLTLGREPAPPMECGTYATHSLWLWDVCAGMHTYDVRKGSLCVSTVCVSVKQKKHGWVGDIIQYNYDT